MTMKKLENEKIKFELESEKGNITINFVKATPFIRKKIAELLKQKPKSQDEKMLETQFKILQAAEKYKKEDLSQQEIIVKALAQGEISAEEIKSLTQSNIDEVETNDTYNLLILQSAIDKTKLKKEEIKLIDSDISSDFWQFQDSFMVESAVNYFRTTIRI